MTREQFDEIDNFDDLRSFCWDNELYTMDNVYGRDDFDGYVCDRIRDCLEYDSWEDVLSWMESIPMGGDYYYVDDYGEIYIIDDDFDDWHERVEDDAVYNEVFVDDDDEDNETEPAAEEWEEEFSFQDLNAGVTQQYSTFMEIKRTNETELASVSVRELVF